MIRSIGFPVEYKLLLGFAHLFSICQRQLCDVLSAFTASRMLTDFDLGRIKQELLRTRCIADVARSTGFSRTAVRAAIGRQFKRPKSVRPLPEEIRRRRSVLRRLAAATAQKQHRRWPKYSSSAQLRGALAQETGELLSNRQIQRELHAIGLKPYVRPRHATRSRSDMIKKAAFARRYRNVEWQDVVFSDESWLCCNERTGRVHWCKHREEALAIEKKARWNVPSIMVWGCIGHNWKSELVIFPSKTTVDGEARQFRLDAASYVRRCLSTVSAKLVRDRRLFQQDGARSHASRLTMAYLARKKVDVMDGWPPYSPELNAIERIWKELHGRVGARCPMSTEELVDVAKDEWRRLPQELINRHCAHFATQLRDL